MIGKDWIKYFKTKTNKELDKQIKTIEHAIENLDEKIKDEFQLSYLNGLIGLIDIAKKKGGQKSSVGMRFATEKELIDYMNGKGRAGQY